MMAGSAAAGGSLADLFGSDSSPKWLTVRTTADLARAGVPADLRARIETDLHAGFIVVTPREPSSMEAVGWWRVDPRTGDTLSIGNRGWGQAQVESMGLNVTMAGVAIFGLCTLGVVLLGGSKDAAILCFAVGVTIAGGGIMVGGIAVGGFNGGAAFGIAAVQTLLSSAMVTWLGLSMLSH
jgi:hypothetical protein